MSGTPGPAHVQFDTSGVFGSTGPLSKGTQYQASNAQSDGLQDGEENEDRREWGSTEPGARPHTDVDTSATDGTHVDFTPVSTAISGTLDTLHPGPPGPGSNPAYRAPGGPVAGSTRDTSLTDVQPGGSVTNPVPSSQNASNTETADIGATGTTTGDAPVAPAGTPTAVTGPRYVTVGWSAVADPSGDPVTEYIIENDRGGRWVSGRNTTSKRIDYIDPSQTYMFRVAARNKGGIGPFSAFSAEVRSYNPDAPDVMAPAAIPIYRLDGTIKPGTGGTNNAPTGVSATAGAADSLTVTVGWTAPSVGDAPTSYRVVASDGTVFTSAAGTTSADCEFDEAGAEVTFTVQAVNAKGVGIVSAATEPVTVP